MMDRRARTDRAAVRRESPMTIRAIRRLAATTILAASISAAGLATPALADGAEATAPGTCDLLAPRLPGFSCFDSDDVAINLASAFTKSGLVHQHINVDWQLSGSNRGVILNGWGRIKSGQVGKLTLTVDCFKGGQARPYHVKQTSVEATTSFHLGKDTGKLVNATCPSTPQLSAVKVTLKFVTGAGTVQQLSRVAAFGAS